MTGGEHYFKKIPLIVAAMLVCVMIATGNVAYAKSVDFSRPGDIGYTTLSSEEILTRYLGTEISDFERQYLAENDDFALTYSDSIDSSNINYRFSGDTLDVSASSYKYTAKNGKTVTWTPTKAWINGRQMNYANGKWTTGVVDSDDDLITVEYVTDNVTVSVDDINSMLNKAYNASKAAFDKLQEASFRYERELEAYNNSAALYEQYLRDMQQYEEDLDAYNQYQADYKAWKIKYDEYVTYLNEYSRYQEELKEYEEYLKVLDKYYEDLKAYQQYLTDCQTYREKLAAYDKEMSSPNVQKALYHLTILDYLTKPVTELQRTISWSILGDAVTQVLAETEALILAGAEKAAVNRANDATVNLRRLLNQYITLQSDEDRYIYYIACYDQLRDNFNVLLRTLDYFYSFDAVRATLSAREKTAQYEILIAQLYYICNALDNNPVANYIKAYKFTTTGAGYFDSSYRIGPSKKTPASLVGADGVLEDRNDALPLEGGFVMPTLPIEPEEVENPGPMPQHKQPIEPDKVEDPGAAPAEVANPTKPEPVPVPSEEPIPYVPTAKETALADAYDGGVLTERTPAKDDYIISLKTVVSKYFRNAKVVRVRFYLSEDAANPSYVIEDAEVGSYIEYPSSLPQPTKTRTGYTCIFDYWQDENHTRINLNRLDSEVDLNLYPHFREVANLYEMAWSVDGKVIEEEFVYDSSPVYDETKHNVPLTKIRDGVRLYRFIGWQNPTGAFYGPDEQLPAMTEDYVVYEAVFEASFIVEWWVDDNITQMSVWKGEIPVYNGGTPTRQDDATFRYEFAGWDREIEPATEDVIYKAVFNAQYIVGFGEGGAEIVNDDGVYVADCTADTEDSDKTLDIQVLLSIAAQESAAVRFMLTDSTLDMSAAAVYAALEGGVSRIALESLCIASGTYQYSLKMYDGGGKELALTGCNVSIAAIGSFNENSILTATDLSGNTSNVRFLINDNVVSFTMRAGYIYNIRPVFSVGIVPSEFTSLSVSKTDAEAGEWVDITLGDIPAGMFVSSLYVLTSDGEQIEITDSGFYMPNSAVVVGVVCDYYVYTIVFKADGKTLVVRNLKYGEAIMPPTNPVKASDGVYQYTFAGWDKEIGTVTGDIEFNAVFTSSPIPEEPKPESKLNKLIRFLYVAVPVFLVLAAGGTVLIIVLIRKKRAKIADTSTENLMGEQEKVEDTENLTDEQKNDD